VAVDRHDLRAPVGERAGLVEDQGPDARHRLERPRALDEDPEVRRAREARDQRHRYGEDQWAGCRHHENGDGADRIAGEPPRCPGDGEGDREEAERPAVREARHRGLGPLRLLHEPDDPGIGAVRGRPGRGEVEGLARVGRSAHRLAARREADGERFPSERRGVREGRGREDGAVHRDHVPLPDQEPVARHDVVEGHLLETTVPVAGRGARHAREKVVHLAPGPALCEALEESAARVHHGDDRGRQRLAEDQRRRHRQRRHDVEAHLAATEAAQDLDHERGQSGQDAGEPDRIGETPVACGIERETRDEAGDREKKKRRLEAIGPGLGHVSRILKPRPSWPAFPKRRCRPSRFSCFRHPRA
jgi:hypothetical protein